MAIYYVKNGGEDSNTGFSDAQAWATIGKVNSINFANYDVIQLKRGSVFSDATLTLNSTSVGISGIIIQDYGSGDKPRIDGNSVRPIFINHALVNLALKNIDISGSDTAKNRCTINNVNGIVIDGIDYNGHTGSSSYIRSSALAVSHVDGDIEIKNCTIQNVMKDTFVNSLSAWGINDATGLIMYNSGDENVKLTGSISIHGNSIHNIYSDCIQLGGMHVSADVYDNELYNYGENAIDIKYSRYVDFYQNDVHHNDFGAKDGSGWLGPCAVCSGLSANWSSTYRARDNIIRDNYFHDTGFKAISTPGSDCIIKNNYIKDCFGGIEIAYTRPKIYNNIFECTTGKTTIEPYSSRFMLTELSCIRLKPVSRADVLIYNNSFYITDNDHLYGIAIQANKAVTGTIIKNNIIQMTRNSAAVYPLYVEDNDNDGNLPTIQNNLLYGAHPNRVKIEETPGNWKIYDATEQEAWRAAGHTGALFANPVFVNANSGDLTLQSSSPAINKGADLGSPYNLGLDPTSMWPHSVKTLNQYDYGTGWEIGAYVYGAVEAPAKGIIVNLDYPASVKHGGTVDINAATENIGSLPGLYKMEIWRDGVLKTTSPLFTLAAGATSTDKIAPFIAPATGASMAIDIKCIRVTS